jgi:DNA polymerase-3 subunit alpha
MGFLTLEDFSGHVEVIVFADPFEQAGEALVEDAVVAVEGRVSTRENEAVKIIAERVLGLEQAQAEWGGAIEIEFERHEVETMMPAIESVLSRFSGPGQVVLKIVDEDGEAVRVLAQSLQVEISGESIRAIGDVVGGERVRLTPHPKAGLTQPA